MKKYDIPFLKVAKILLALLFLTGGMGEVVSAQEPLTVNVQLKDRALGLVLKDIADSTGYVIRFDADWRDRKVSGRFNRVSLENFFRRALREDNFFITYNEEKRVVTVQLLTRKSHLISTSINDSLLPQQSEGYVNMTPLEIKNLHQQYARTLKTQKENLQRVDEITGLDASKILDMHNVYARKLVHDKDNPDIVNTFTGMTHAEIVSLHDVLQQKQEKGAGGGEQNGDVFTGMTRLEIKSMHKEYQQQQAAMNGDSIVTGLSESEIVAMHERLLKKEVSRD